MVFRRARPLKAIEGLVVAGGITFVWADGGSHHFSAGYRLFALVGTGLWAVVLLLRALRVRIGIGREVPGELEEHVEGHERRPLGRGWVVAGVAIAALAIGITVVELIRLSV